MKPVGKSPFPSFSTLEKEAPGHALSIAKAHIREREHEIRAWVHLPDGQDGDYAVAPNPGMNSNASDSRPMNGIPFAVKDVIDVSGMPTRCGSAASDERSALVHAASVDLLVQAGAVPIGKVVTAEYAFRNPGPTRNPWNLAYTPGGSSSGSAAAVAAGMVPLALSTQTGGSIIRPAAYCGVPALKPSYGLVSRAGMTLTSESLDTIGWHGASIDWIRRAAEILLPRSASTPSPSLSNLRIAVIDRAPEAELEADGRDALDAAMAELQRAGADCHMHDASDMLAELGRAHTVIMKYEFARNLAPVVHQHSSLLSASLLKNVEEGWQMHDSLYLDMCALQHELRMAWDAFSGGADFILTPAATGPAPLGHAFSGAPAFNKCWTVLGWPCLHVPVLCNAKGLPVGVQLIGPWKRDFDVIALGAKLETLLQQLSTSNH